jgi:AraC-like DNA-binding protein
MKMKGVNAARSTGNSRYMSIFEPISINLWKTIDSYGIDPEPLFAAEHIKIQLPVDTSLRIPYVNYDRIRAKAVAQSGDEAFGLKMASLYSPSHLGALGYAIQASTTLRSACLRLKRFARVVNSDSAVCVEDRNGFMVVTHKESQPTESEAVRDDMDLAVIIRNCRMIYGDKFRLQSVNFKHSEPRDIKPYFEFFGCQLNFNQDENQLLIPLSMVDEILEGASPELALLNDQVLMRRLAQIDRNDIIARVQAVLVDRLPEGNITDDLVASALHMSVRTLHRKLAKAKSSLRTIVMETRQKLVKHYILDTSLTLTEISLLLGFSESSSFSRAFKTWTGSTPTEARQTHIV